MAPESGAGPTVMIHRGEDPQWRGEGAQEESCLYSCTDGAADEERDGGSGRSG